MIPAYQASVTLGILSLVATHGSRCLIFSPRRKIPIVLHCTAGKDRTGVSTAFLLSVLGVDRAIIEADYLLTNVDVNRQVEFVEQHVGLPEGMTREEMAYHAGVPETAMRDFWMV